MKKLILFLACCVLMFPVGCSSVVSREEYDAVAEERDELKGQIETEEAEDDENSEESTGEEGTEKSTKFNFGNGGEIAIIIDNAPSVDVWIHSEDAEECSLAFAYYYSLLSDESMSNCDTSILCYYGNELCVMWNKTESGESIFGVNSDGSPTSTLPDWIITDTEKFTLDETDQANILSELQENTLDFVNQ